MKKLIFLLFFIFLSSFVLAELKPSQDYNIPAKLTAEETKDAPRLFNNVIYPGWGSPCMEFTYKVMYSDEKGRQPEYVRINLNGNWHDMEEVMGDYKRGMLYQYKYVPTSDKPNFFYFEASNGVGKARAGIIDSPDQGPTIYPEKFDNNQIILLDKNGKEIWAYDTGKDMVEGVSISKNGYVVAVTNYYIHLFSKDSKEPLWKYCEQCQIPQVVLGNFAGIEISADGNYIAAALQNNMYYFKRDSKEPLWTKPLEAGVIGLDISEDGSLIAIGTANAGEKGDKILIYDNKGNKLFEYRASHLGYEQTGNFYQPDMTPDGKHIAVSTGCPDRRAYLFSKEGDLIFRSEQLTYDSPVHKSTISDDGSLAAYSLDHASGKEIVILFDNKGNKLWGFSSTSDSTSRGVSMSSDGNYIAAGTSAGNIYLFSKDSNKPLWKFSESIYTQIGEVKLNSDGSLLAAGGTSKKIYMFSKNSNKPLWTYNANTWVTKLDFNGEYVVGGTGLREYMGEGMREEIGEFNCKEIIKIPEEQFVMGEKKTEEDFYEGEVICGDGICIPRVENYENCPQDCGGEGEGYACAQFDDNEKECLIHSEMCIWISGEDICESLSEVGENKEKIKEEPKSEEIEEKKSLFRIIIDFFKGLFGK